MITELLGPDAVTVARDYNVWAALSALLFWCISGVSRIHTSEPSENGITFLFGSVLFGLAYGSWEAAHGGDAHWRVFYFNAVLTALVLGLGWRILRRLDQKR